MIKSKTLWIIMLLIYIGISVIKLFVGIIHPMGGTSVYLVVKKYPTLKNEWILGEENPKNSEIHKGNWYYEGKYTIIAKGENGVIGQNLLKTLSRIWWMVTIVLLIILPILLIYRKK